MVVLPHPVMAEKLGTSKNPLRMMFVPSGDSQVIVKGGKEVGDLLHKETGLHFKTSVATSYATVIEAMGAGKVDIGWLATFSYVLAKDKYDVEEGEEYTFGKIDFVGNTVYNDEFLSQILRIEEGDTYNGVELKKRIANEEKPDGIDITNVYQNTGYMFSSINPVEVSADGNVIDLEIRITEGKPAYFNSVSVKGNDVAKMGFKGRDIGDKIKDLEYQEFKK